MSIAVFVTNETDAKTVIPWGARFAVADSTSLMVIVPKKSKGKECWNDVVSKADCEDRVLLQEVARCVEEFNPTQFTKPQDEDAAQQESTITIREIVSPDPERAFVESVAELGIRFLIIPAHDTSKTDGDHWVNRLLVDAPCETMVIRGPFPDYEQPLRIAVATQGEADSDTDSALDRAKRLTDAYEGELSLLFVRPDDDKFAMHVAQYQMKRLDQNTRVSLADIPKTIVLQENLRPAIINHCSNKQLHLVLTGTRNLNRVKELLRPFDSTETQTSIATLREGIPFSSRVVNAVRLWTRSRVPQMKREQRVKLVDRLNSNSNFDFDLVALIVLSTLIAALGLVQNSGAVVIGAMLVAPLMTPLVGIGFALVQGNERLARISIKSVALGFAVAFAMGVMVGLLLTAGHWIGLLLNGVDVGASELQARGHPTLLDWFVAFISGIAAAYAIGRPNLLSALPGVAIAAALVPPVATSGIALAVLDIQLSVGASLLFFTNIVAIALGTALTFWAVGVDSRSEAKKSEGKAASKWPRYVFLAFVVLSLVLALTMSLRNRSEIQRKNLNKQPSPAVQSEIAND